MLWCCWSGLSGKWRSPPSSPTSPPCPQLTHPYPLFPSPFLSPYRQVISYNAHRAHLIWPKLHGFLRGLLEDQVEVAIVRCPYLLERCVVTVLRAVVVVGMRSSQPPPQQQQPHLPLITNNINTAAPQTHVSTVVQTTQTPFAAANGTHSFSADPHHSAATATAATTTAATPTTTTTNHHSHPHPLLHPPSGVPLSIDNNHYQAYGGGSLGGGPYSNTVTIRPSSYSSSSSSSSSSLAWLLSSLSLLKDLPSDLMTVVADRIAVGLLALVRHAGPGPSQNLHAVRLLTSGSGLAPAQGPGLAVGIPLFAQLDGHSGPNQLPIITTNTNTTTTTTTGVTAIPITSTPIVTSTSTTMPMKNTSGSATASGNGSATASGSGSASSSSSSNRMIGLIEGGDQWGVVLSLLATAGARETYTYSPIHTFIHPYIHTYIHTHIHTPVHTYTNTLIRIYTPTRNITLT